ncbi:TPA: hypothetical protein N0F65_005125 [Lagenidium giganteum]|uniref:phosphatidylinositol-3,5-bisphosphate 3-phosphatase n=1 Tax=Lagenidium giganteum TaxID=4803 RepID=A0AAV2YTG2_9STRA|nr:TPA: hypothetical protein N0F65_005125 [Lagenidium giganteum]
MASPKPPATPPATPSDGRGDLQLDALKTPAALVEMLLRACQDPLTQLLPRDIATEEDEDDDDDDDEDAADATEEQRLARRQAQRASRARTHTESLGDEPTIEAIAAALNIAKLAVDTLQRKLLEQAARGRDGERGRARIFPGDGRYGVPQFQAPTVSSGACAQCKRVFSAFNRGKACQSCGHLFCTRCASSSLVLPQQFGHGNRPVRTCDPCIKWFRAALESYCDVVLGSGPPSTPVQAPTPSSVQSIGGNPRSKLSRRSLSSPDAGPEEEETAQPLRQTSSQPKHWFSSNLRALHVSDRPPRTSKRPHLGSGGDADTEFDPSFQSPALSDFNLPSPINERSSSMHELDSFQLDRPYSMVESSEGEEAFEEDEVYIPEPLTIAIAKPNNGVEKNGSSEASIAAVATSKRAKFARSASFDMTNLKTMVENDDSKPKKCFDDTDIVDAVKTVKQQEPRAVADLPATVLRFAVFDVGAKDSLRKSFGFGKRNIELDRFTLEVDSAQGVVRLKSVFMHRFWSFRCTSVQSIIYTSGVSTAQICLFNETQRENLVELQFASDDEREEFKLAVEACKEILQGKKKPDRSSPPRRRKSSRGSLNDDGSDAGRRLSTSSVNDMASIVDALEAVAAITEPSIKFFPGEVLVKESESLASLLIGPPGESLESSLIWGRIRGQVSVTNYRVLFMPFEKGHVPFRTSTQGAVAYIPLFAIISVQVLYPYGRRTRSVKSLGTPSAAVLSITCKDARTMRFEVNAPPPEADDKLQALQTLITKLADNAQRYRTVEQPPVDCNTENDTASESAETSLVKFEQSGVFAFSYALGSIPPEVNGWDLYTDEREVKRQIGQSDLVQPFLKFYQNASGAICQSYPSKILLPASMNSSTVAQVAAFRAKNRLPVITYYHRRNRCVLTRSGQPLLGNLLSGSSSLADQLLVGVYRRLPEIIKNQSHSSTSSRPIYIFDARKLKASTGNRLMGKGGVETSQDYPGAVICHLNIANMYRMQSSFQSLMKLVLPGGVEDQDSTWWSAMESTKWVSHVRLILEGALKIARVIELEGSSVLVHCSDGWDRTSQLVCLAQLMIDPYFRTIRGFAVLVEKDWCAFGHKFAERTGGDRQKDPNRNKSSPVMLQFLDAVWQILRQFPYAFEFNEKFLIHIANSLTSGLYGTFLYDSRLQREANQVSKRTVSVWTPVLMTPKSYTNPDYVMWEKPIWPWTSCQMVELWESYFFQWHPKYFDCRWISSLVHYGPYQPWQDNRNENDDNRERPQASISGRNSKLTVSMPSSPSVMSSSRSRNDVSSTPPPGSSRSTRKGPHAKPRNRNIFLFKN